MNLVQALEHLNQGRVVSSPSVVANGIKFLNGELVHADTEETVVPDNELLNATDFVVVEQGLQELSGDEAYMYFDAAKARWISTTKPQKHLQAGARVAIFSIAEEVV